MSSVDIVLMSMRNLFKRKLRTFLTILGVVIGTAAIIVMVSLGLAVNASFEESLAYMGDIRVLTVRNPGSGGGGGMMVAYSGGGMSVSYGGSSSGGGRQSEEKVVLNEKALNAFKQIPNVYAATPVVSIQMTAKSGKFTTWLDIKGIDPSTMMDFDYKLQAGELLKGDKNGIVFGSEMPFNFYNPNDRNYWRNIDWENRVPNIDIFNDKIEMSFEEGYGYEDNNPIYQSYEDDSKQKPKPYKIAVNGWLESMGYETDYYAFMDIEEVLKIKLAQQRYRQNEGIRYYGSNNFSSTEYDTIMVKCDDINNVEKVMAEIEKQGFYVDSYYIDVLNQMKEMSRSLQLFLGAIGAVSLFVAAIGIANTMIMAIYERTREIGIMKVIGASIKDIKKLFLLEAILIGFIGGGIGILLSLGISHLLNTAGVSIMGMIGGGGGGVVSLIPMWLCGVALAFSSFIGLVSGYFPAIRAMNLSALAAIRTE